MTRRSCLSSSGPPLFTPQGELRNVVHRGGVPIRVEIRSGSSGPPCRCPIETDNNRGPVIPVSERSFADRSGLVEIHVTRATSGEDLRRQLDGVRRQVRINAAAVEVGGGLHLQAALC